MDLSPQDFVANARCSLFFRLINAWKYIDKTQLIFQKCNLINNVNVILFRLRCMVIFSHQRHIVTFLFFFHSPNGLNNVLYISSCTCKNNKQKRLKHDGISLQFWFKPSLFVVWHHPYRPKKITSGKNQNKNLTSQTVAIFARSWKSYTFVLHFVPKKATITRFHTHHTRKPVVNSKDHRLTHS